MKQYSIGFAILLSILLVGCSSFVKKEENVPNCVDGVCTVTSNMTAKEELQSWMDFLHCDRLDIESLSSGEMQSGTIQGIVELYDYKIHVNPNDLDAYLKRGFLKYYMGSYSIEDTEKAILDFDKVIEIDSRTDYSDLTGQRKLLETNYCYRGSAKGTKNDLTGAMEDFTRMIEINPQSINGYTKRAAMVDPANIGNPYSGAIDDYNKLILLDSDNPKSYWNRGIIKGVLGKHSDGEEDLKKACELDSIYCQKYTSGEMFTL